MSDIDLYQWGGGQDGREPQRPDQPPAVPQPGGRDYYQWGGGQGNPQVPQPGGRDYYQWGGDRAPQYPQPVAPNPWQSQWQMEQQQMRPRQVWGGRGAGGGDIFITAMPGSEIVINNAGDLNMPGGRNYDYRYPGGNMYNYQQFLPRQIQQPNYEQYRGCFRQQECQPVYAPNYYSGADQYQWQQPQYRQAQIMESYPPVAMAGGPSFSQNINMGGYDFGRHGGHNGRQRHCAPSFYPEQPCNWGQQRGNYQHGSQRFPQAYQCHPRC